MGPVTNSAAAPVNTQKWFRRHIIVNHFDKSILIQVMHLQSGELNFLELQQIKSEHWRKFLPQGLSTGDIEVRREINALVASGYQVRPVFFSGIENEDMAVLLLTDIHEPKLTQFTA